MPRAGIQWKREYKLSVGSPEDWDNFCDNEDLLQAVRTGEPVLAWRLGDIYEEVPLRGPKPRERAYRFVTPDPFVPPVSVAPPVLFKPRVLEDRVLIYNGPTHRCIFDARMSIADYAGLSQPELTSLLLWEAAQRIGKPIEGAMQGLGSIPR